MRPAAALAALLALAAACAPAPPAALELPRIFGDAMVLQQGIEVPVWGRAEPGTEVSVAIAGQRKTVVTDADGGWSVRLDPLAAGGPHQLTVSNGRSVRFDDVLVGEVWLASGQSNMEMPLAGWGRVLDYEAEIAAADYPRIRLFQVERGTAMRPLDDVDSGGWRPTTSESVAEFSATAYFFGRRLHRELGVPVGLVHSSWGGTAAESWIGTATLERFDAFRDEVRAVRATTDDELARMAAAFETAFAERQRRLEHDAGLSAGDPLWVAPELDDASWETMELPTKWEDAGLEELDGVVWYRREIDLPESWAGRELTLGLGPIDDADETWFNGVRIGSGTGWSERRRYVVPAGLARPGRNVITVRVVDTLSSGGIWGEAAELRLELPGEPPLPLAGAWRYRIGADSRELEPLPLSPHTPHRPSVLYNAMLRPLAPFALRGVIWYQGESNVERAEQYRTLFPALIQDWRATWGRDDLPFYFVQLANFLAPEAEPVESDWAELRDAQRAALELPHTGMAVAIDIGDAHDIHPKNKQAVGQRLARIALNRLYGRPLVDSGPVYREARREGSRVRLLFDSLGGGLEARGAPVRGFAIAGPDRRFHWADAAIDGDTIVVWSPDVPRPEVVRYAWAANPIANLYNQAGLPAVPFQAEIGERH